MVEPFQNYFLNLPTTNAFICCINNFKTCVSKKKKKTSKYGYTKAYKPLSLSDVELVDNGRLAKNSLLLKGIELRCDAPDPGVR